MRPEPGQYYSFIEDGSIVVKVIHLTAKDNVIFDLRGKLASAHQDWFIEKYEEL